jgi:hypothetical protein
LSAAGVGTAAHSRLPGGWLTIKLTFRHEHPNPQPTSRQSLSIGFDKTVMNDLLEIKPDDVVLEIGTGLGYQAGARRAGQQGVQRRKHR